VASLAQKLAPKVGTIHFDVARQSALRACYLYAFADLVQQNEGCLVVNAQIAGQLQCAVTLRAIYEDRDCGQNIADRQLAAGKDCA